MQSLRLADPRCFAASSDHPAVLLAERSLVSTAASQLELPAAPVAAYFRDVLERKEGAQIDAALAQATSARVYRCLWRALDDAVDPAAGAEGVSLRLFALPLLIVTGGMHGAVIRGALPDIAGVQQVLEASGALGRARNFGLGNALCSLASLQCVSYQRLYDLSQALPADVLAGLELPPQDVHATTADEEVHLRYLVGAAVTPADAPSFLETGSAIAVWGLPLTRELAQQMRTPGASVLPLPRPPSSLLAARVAGFVAREELSLQVFVSRVLRRFRAEVGEPDTTLAALESGAIGLRFASPFIENRVAVHRRALHPSEALSEVTQAIGALLEECRVEPVAALDGIVSDAEFERNVPAARQ